MPVTKLESSEARNTAAFATSSGSPMRPIGIVAGILAMASWGCRSTSGVLMTLTLATEPMRMIDAPRSSALGLFAPRTNVLFTLRSNSLSKCSSVRFARERIRRRRHWRPGHQSFPSPSRSRRADRGLAVLRRPLERLRRCCRLPFTASSRSFWRRPLGRRKRLRRRSNCRGETYPRGTARNHGHLSLQLGHDRRS
jgi:hypothetical protein